MKKSKLRGQNVLKDLKKLKRGWPNKIREVRRLYKNLLSAQPKKISFVLFESVDFPGLQMHVVRRKPLIKSKDTFLDRLVVMHSHIVTPVIKPKIRLMTHKQFHRVFTEIPNGLL